MRLERWLSVLRPKSVSRELTLGFAAKVALLLFVSGIAILTLQHTSSTLNNFLEEHARLTELALKSNNSLAKARRYEKDFILNFRTLGYDEASARYLTFFRIELAEMRGHIRTMRSLSDASVVVLGTRQVEEGLRIYENGFLHVVDLYAQLGHDSTGIAGLMNAKAVEIESRLRVPNAAPLRIALYECRGHEKDFLIRLSDDDVRLLTECRARFERLLAGSPLGAVERAALLTRFRAYVDWFMSYVRISSQIETQQLAYLAAANGVVPRLEKLYVDSWRDAQLGVDDVRDEGVLFLRLVVSASVLAILIAFSIAWLVRRDIDRSVDESIDFAGQIAAGNLERRIAPPRHLEFAALANSLNTMADVLRDARMAQDRRESELEERVAERTSELASVADSLRAEVEMRKKTEQAVELARDAAESANRAKGEFVANVSHEIRTPMNAVIGLTDLLLRSPLSAQQRDFLGMIKTSAHALLRLLNDILDFSKMEARKLELEQVDFNLSEVIGNALKPFAAQASSKGIELASRVPTSVSSWMSGDPGRLTQILVNLVGNALKFTERGEVIVRVDRMPANENQVALHFSVSDTGVGISAEQQRTIFDAFVQGDKSATGDTGGTGLGLSIVFQLVDLMGGRVWLDSAKGVGSTFHFTVALGVAAQPRARRGLTLRSTFKSRLVLVVDDNRSYRVILGEILRGWEMRPVLVESAAQALERLHQAEVAGKPFDLILVDSGLPAQEGFHLVEAVSARRPTYPVVMLLSGPDPSRDVERCQRLGVKFQLSKPVKNSELFDAVVMALGIAPQAWAIAPVAASIKAMRRLRVLVADDHPINQRVACEMLAAEGHTVSAVANGMEVLHAMATEQYDVILMDGQMPQMDGYETAREIRRREQASGAPRVRIIAVTAHAMEQAREQCLAAGIDDYVVKPIDADKLRACLPTQSDLPRSPVESAPSTELVFDEAGLLRRVRGKRTGLHRLISLFLEELPGTVTELARAARAGEAEVVLQDAHRLQGAASSMGAPALAAAARKLEEAARRQELDVMLAALPDLEERAARLETVLRGILAESEALS